MIRNYKMILKYDGERYFGWQIQPNKPTVQGELTKALEIITKKPVMVYGVSRTDAGVHALGYVCSALLDTEIELSKLFYSINGILNKDIRLISIDYCSDDFNARLSSVAKTYVYTIDNTLYGEPFLRGTSWHWGKKLDFDKMEQAGKCFIGTHDFSSFMSAGGSAKEFTRTIYAVDTYIKDDIIKIEITGNGFLYNMVRIIVGTLLLVGTGKLKPCDIPDIIKKKDRTAAGITAPPEGLALLKVYYNEEDTLCLAKNHHSLKEY